MIFLWLALVALVFGLLGFLVHAFYFGKKDRVTNLEREIESMARLLARRDQARTEAEQQMEAANRGIRVLEMKLAQGSEQVGGLQARIRQQADQIRQLQKAAFEIRLAIAPAMGQENVVPEFSGAEPNPVAENNGKLPLWKDNLNNILEMLDKIEKEDG